MRSSSPKPGRSCVFRSFSGHDKGNVAIIASLSLAAMAGVAGAALDYTNASMAHTDYQAALDSAVLAGVSGFKEDADKIETAGKYFSQNHPNLGTIQAVQFQNVDGELQGSATVRVKTRLMKVLNIDFIDVAVKSAATAEAVRVAMCVMAMHPTRKHTLELHDSVTVKGPDCNIYGNSNHPWDVVDPHTTETFLIGKSVQAIGYGHHYLENVSPPLEYAPELIADPFSGMTIPAAGSCLFTSKEVKGGFTTLSPGTYCKGLKVNNGAKVTLNPGTYIISGGTFEVDKAWVSGEGVTIVLADNSTDLDWQEAEVRLSAPKTGTYKSVVLMSARVENSSAFTDSTVDLHGVVYMPNMEIDWVNKATPKITAKWTVWMVDGFSWSGDGTIDIPFKPEESDIPYPGDLNVIPRSGQPRLVF